VLTLLGRDRKRDPGARESALQPRPVLLDDGGSGTLQGTFEARTPAVGR